jgi:hypothetical protein
MIEKTEKTQKMMTRQQVCGYVRNKFGLQYVDYHLDLTHVSTSSCAAA